MSRGSTTDAEESLRQWKHHVDARDQLVRAAHEAGVTINRIHVLSGIGRSTIYRILGQNPESSRMDTA